jgi:CRISPR system Cascade subunit CasC
VKIELHLLQNFAPSNLNRDDTGSPKNCEFGGVRRGRISSQCLKRAVRQAFDDHHLFGEKTKDVLAARTKRLVDQAAKLVVHAGKREDESRKVLAFALQSAKLKVVEDDKTQYLLFLPRRVIRRLADVVLQHWGTLVVACAAQDESAEEGAKKKSKSADKKAAKEAVPKEVATIIEQTLEDARRTPDLALFGRMIADNPDWNVDAACQMAHAISTNRVSIEFDFYTAVDDFRPSDHQGSDMMGTVAFQSSCFYRYSCIDVDALRKNLGASEGEDLSALTKQTIEAFVRACAYAIPTGKQNSMAAQNRPSYLLAVVRERGTPQSLANAFVKPVRPTGDKSLVEASVAELENYLERTLGLWGDHVKMMACAEVEATGSSRPERLKTFDAWVSAIGQAAGGSS